ncbi:archease [Candidatus Woesearchaeota archaeon]|nr:archease [Candidatus Woesearchaeota archaeon]
MKYKYLPHTADAKFRAFGESLEEAFSNAALAVFNVMVDTNNVKGQVTKKIDAEGTDLQSLLYNFLEKFLILLDAENFFLAEVKKIKISGKEGSYKIAAEVLGDDAAKYETIGPQVKAITYNDMVVDNEKGNCFVQVVVDI